MFPVLGEEPHPQRMGWHAWIRQVVQPDLLWGVGGIVVHCPFGIEFAAGTKNYSFDQAVHAAEMPTRARLVTSFADAFRPLVDKGVRVVAYLGKHREDPDFEELKKAGRRDEWMARSLQSVSPLLRAGVEIGFDASSDLAADAPEWGFIELLRSMGVVCWIEARPVRSAPHLHALPVISTEWDWQHQDPSKDQGAKRWAAPTEMLKGDVLRWVNVPPPGRRWDEAGEWMTKQVREIQAEGHYAGVAARWLRLARVRLDRAGT